MIAAELFALKYRTLTPFGNTYRFYVDPAGGECNFLPPQLLWCWCKTQHPDSVCSLRLQTMVSGTTTRTMFRGEILGLPQSKHHLVLRYFLGRDPRQEFDSASRWVNFPIASVFPVLVTTTLVLVLQLHMFGANRCRFQVRKRISLQCQDLLLMFIKF